MKVIGKERRLTIILCVKILDNQAVIGLLIHYNHHPKQAMPCYSLWISKRTHLL